MARLSVLLAASCLGTAAALLAGRALLGLRPPLTPDTPAAALETTRRWSPDPWRRREASLLLHGQGAADGPGRRRLLRGQAWGTDPVAAVVLKLDALDAAAQGNRNRADLLWRRLLRRFPADPASADALYALGRTRPALRQTLLRRFPAHPAALAAALEQGPGRAARLEGALHLARWGARWPGAEERLRQGCDGRLGPLAAAAQGQLATGLAALGDGEGALGCLDRAPGGRGAALAQRTAADRLLLAQALLKGPPPRQALAEQWLLEVARTVPDSPEAEEAVRRLAQEPGPQVAGLLERLPARWRDSAPVRAHAVMTADAAARSRAALPLLRRWPEDPASWDLQWDLAREHLLAGRWGEARTLLEAVPPERLSPLLASRQRFWLGYVQQQQGQQDRATATWRELRRRSPGGYYGWRAAVRLGEGDLDLNPGGPRRRDSWQPLASGDPVLDGLWRLGQRTETWERWRERRGGRPPVENAALLVEGRLRQGVGDDWTGFGQLEQVSLRLEPERCDLLPTLERSLHPHRFMDIFATVAERKALPVALLMGVAKQESRFTPSVRSVAGAVGLLQLMPATAAELAGGPLSDADLEDPQRNVSLGGLYLRGLLRQWQGNPLLAVASYNAGPGAVGGWRSPRLQSAPELWVEAIPYPETRLYVKKVLGNVWTYQTDTLPGC